MDTSYKRHSRRSHPNLQLLTVTPLTPNFPLPATVDDAPGPAAALKQQPQPEEPTQHVISTPKSYLEARSLPQTPSILSRSNSRSRHRPSSHSSVAIADLAEGLEQRGLSPHARRGGSHKRSHSAKMLRPPDNTGWILQTASTLAMSTAESKGQAWLATRTSSTSLADATLPIERLETYTADDEFSPVSHRHASRSQSRFGSRGTSRRGSRVGIMTPVGLKTPGERDVDALGYFDTMGPDFVDALDEEVIVDDDNEMRRIVWGRVGGWVDWAVGWMDFREDLVEEEEEEVAGEEGEQGREPQQPETSSAQPQQRKGGLKGKGPAGNPPRRKKRPHYGVTEKAAEVPPAPQSESMLSDAAWLLGLARNSLA